MKKRMLSLLLVLAMVASLTACGKKDQVTKLDGTFTYSITSSNPNTWSPTDWENADENTVMALTQMYLYDFIMNDTKDGYEIVPETAAELPVDTTKDYAGTYGIPADAEEGYAWTIALNKDACWEDGTKITAHDYEYTLQQFLNPEMKNYRASSWYSGTTALYKASEYYSQGGYTAVCVDAGTYKDVADEEMAFNLTEVVPFFGDGSAADYYEAGYDVYYYDEDGNDLYAALSEMGDGYVVLTEESKNMLETIANNFGDPNPEAYKEFTFCKGESATWDEVGFIANDDYTITFIFTNPNTYFYTCYGLTGLSLVKEDIYEACKQQTGEIVKSSYGTAVDKYSSYGPYKIVSFQEDKEMRLTKNENWYGWTDGKHDGQFMTTDIVLSYISEHTTEISLFLQGKLEETALTSEDMDQYGSSDYIYFTPESYTYKYTFNSDIERLKERETEGYNRSIMAYDDFRHAISLAVDNKEYASKLTAAHSAGYGLLNYVYICDPDTGMLYRDSEYAKQALCEVYGVDDYDDITGYNPDEARKYFQSAYEQCLADGNIKETDQVEFDMHVYGSDATYQKFIDFLQAAIDTATVGTDLEDRVTINLVEDQDYYSSLEAGLVDIAITAWGGADFDPYSIVECYFNDNYKLEFGFQPTVETCTLTIDGKEITDTYYNWCMALIEGEYKTADLDTKNSVLAQLEKNFLLEWECVPMSYRNAASLASHRLVYGSDTYINSLVGFGGIRFMTYTMNDEDWEAYCQAENNQLTY